MTVEHDAECAAHEETIKLLRERTHVLTNALAIQAADVTRAKEDLARVQAQVAMSEDSLHRHDVTAERIEAELRGLIDRIPHTLGADIVALSIGLKVVVSELESVKTLVRSDLVGRQEFEPVKRLVYGMVGLVLTSVIVALIALVVKR